MSAQKENGYTPIANELMEALVKYKIPSSEIRCLLFILRKTYGYNKKTDAISLSQFVKATSLNRKAVSRALKNLNFKNLIYVQKGGVKNDTILTSKYRFNKRYKSWLSSVKNDTGSVKTAQKVVSKMTHTKDTIQKKDIPDLKNQGNEIIYTTKKRRTLTGEKLKAFEKFWACFNFKKGKADAADSWYDIKGLSNNMTNKICRAAEQEAKNRKNLKNGQSPKWAQGWLSSRRWEDEIEVENNKPNWKKAF